MKVDKRFLDIGAAANKIGTNKVLDGAFRTLLHNGASQTISGAKSLDTPGHSRAAALQADDLVSKFNLMDSSRCVAVSYDELLVITQQDIANGYVTLGRAVAPGQASSFKVLNYDGASALTVGVDFTLDIDDAGDMRRFRWDTRPLGLGRPGRVIPDQQIDVRYNICKPVKYPTDTGKFSASDYWVMERLDGAWPETGASWNNVKIGTQHEGKTVTFRNIITQEEKSVTLPSSLPGAPDVSLSPYRFTVFRGIPIIFTLPELGEVDYYDSSGELFNRPLSQLFGCYFVDPPALLGKFIVYASDWNVWGKVIEADVPVDLTSYTKVMFIENSSPYCDIAPFGSEYLGLYTTLTWWLGGHVDSFDGMAYCAAAAYVALYDRDFQYVRTESLSAEYIHYLLRLL